MWGLLRSPKRPLPRRASMLKSRYRSLEKQTARTQKSKLGCEARKLKAQGECWADRGKHGWFLATAWSGKRAAAIAVYNTSLVQRGREELTGEEKRRHRIDTIVGRGKIAGVIIPGPDREGDGQIVGTEQAKM